MSQENVEIVRRALEAFAEGRIEDVLGYLDPEMELHSAIVGGAEGNVYHGHEGFRTWQAESEAAFDELSIDLTEFQDLGGRVLGLGRIHARGRESGIELDSLTGWVLTVQNGKIVNLEGFLSRAEALEAAGLSE